MTEVSKCPMHESLANVTAGAQSNRDWWPNQLNLKILQQNPPAGNPLGGAFVYADEFKKLGSVEFSKLLLREAEVAVSPGLGFGNYGDDHVRFALVENRHRINQATRNLKKFFGK